MNEDHFADFLDIMVNDTSSPDAEPPADIARRIQESNVEYLNGTRRSAIWRELMAGHTHDKPTTGGAGPLTQPALTAPDAFNPWVQRWVPSSPNHNRTGVIHRPLQTGITAMAIVAIVIAAFIAFPIFRGDEAPPRVTPTAWAAAPTTSSLAFGSPEAPTTPSATYHHPQPNECKVEPLTVDEVMAVVEGESSGRTSATPENATLRPISEEEHQQITESHRAWLTCHFNGTGLQMLALESDDMIHTESSRANFPTYSQTLVREQIESLEEASSSQMDSSAFTWSPPTDTFIPMVASYDPETAPMVTGGGAK